MGPSLLLLQRMTPSSSVAGKRQLGVRHFARPEGRARRQMGLKSNIIWLKKILKGLSSTTKMVIGIF